MYDDVILIVGSCFVEAHASLLFALAVKKCEESHLMPKIDIALTLKNIEHVKDILESTDAALESIWRNDHFPILQFRVLLYQLMKVLLDRNMLQQEASYTKFLVFAEHYNERHKCYPKDFGYHLERIWKNLNEFEPREDAAALLIIGFIIRESTLAPWTRVEEPPVGL